MSAYKTGENWLNFVDCTNVNFMVLLLYYSYAKYFL